MEEEIFVKKNKRLNVLLAISISLLVIVVVAFSIATVVIGNRDTTVYVKEFSQSTGLTYIHVKNAHSYAMIFDITLIVTDSNGNIVFSYVFSPIKLMSQSETVLQIGIGRYYDGSLKNCTATVKWTGRDTTGN